VSAMKVGQLHKDLKVCLVARSVARFQGLEGQKQARNQGAQGGANSPTGLKL